MAVDGILEVVGEIVGNVVMGAVQAAPAAYTSDCPRCRNRSVRKTATASCTRAARSQSDVLGFAVVVTASLIPVGVLVAMLVSPEFLGWAQSAWSSIGTAPN